MKITLRKSYCVIGLFLMLCNLGVRASELMNAASLTSDHFRIYEEMCIEQQQAIKDIGAFVSDFLLMHINYPEGAKAKGIQGRVICSFLFTEEGKVSEPVILKGLGEEINKEVLRVLQLIPDSESKKYEKINSGAPFRIILPVHFNLMRPTVKG